MDEFQQTTVSQVYGAGETTGIGGLELSLVEGEIAGFAAAGKHDDARQLFPVREKHRRFAGLLNQTFALREELKQLSAPETIVCRCEDVTFARLRAHEFVACGEVADALWDGAMPGTICGAP